jgi:fumarylacetoacetate (FAA) hydrolase
MNPIYNAASLIQSDNSPMKLATYQDGSRDGQLVVVSNDLQTAHFATHIANRLQQVLDDWSYLAPQLQDLYHLLNTGKARHAFALDTAQCMAPLPRAYQWVQAQTYQHPAGASDTAKPKPALRMVQAASDYFLGPRQPIVVAADSEGIDCAAQVAVMTDDLPQGCSAERALEGIRLLVLANTVQLHTQPGTEPHSPLVTGFSPVAVTPDVLGDAWSKGRLRLPLHTSWNGRKVGPTDAADGMPFHFGQILAQVCKTRTVRAGSIVGAGVAGQEPVRLQGGDTLRIDVLGADGASVFGAIQQELVATEDKALVANR